MKRTELAQLADQLAPFLLPLIKQNASGTGGAAGTTTVGAHALDSATHTGTLSWSRVSKVGSALTDLQSRDYAGLTNRAHVLATNAGLGPDHTVSGLTTGHVLRASGATAAAFAQLQHSDLGNVLPDQHHARQHSVTSASDHTIAGAAFAVLGATAVNTLGLLTPLADTTTGTLEALLKSDANGGLRLQYMSTPEVRNPAGSITLNPTGTAVLPTGTIQKDLGDYNRKWRTIYGAELYVETLVAQSVISTIGGRVLVTPTSSLIADIASGTGTSISMDTKHNGFAVGEWLYMAAAPGGVAQVEVFQVTAGPSTITGGYRYTVNRNQDGSGQNAWQAGDAVASLGNALGTGYLDLSATTTTQSHIGPTITVYSRTSTAAWSGVKPTVSMGNLRSFVDYGSNEYGFALGNDLTLTPTTGFSGMAADRTNGLRLFNTDIALYSGATKFLALNTSDGLRVQGNNTGAIDALRGLNFYDNTTFIGGVFSYFAAGGQIWAEIQAGNSLSSRTSMVLISSNGTGNRAVNLTAGSAALNVYSDTVLGTVVDVTSTTFRHNGQAIWTAANDGSGSGLDADTLDTYHAASFALLSGATFTGTVTISTSLTGWRHTDGSVDLRSFITGGVGLVGTISNHPLGFYTNSSGSRMEIQTDGTVRFGNTSDLYSAKIQTNGNIHAQGAVTSELYLQMATASTPGAATGWARIALRSSDNALVAVMPSGAVRVLATN